MRNRLKSKVTLLVIACAALLAVAGTAMALTSDPSGNTAPAPTITSDKADYAPGELVTLTGSGWQSGESVHINVNDTYGATWSRNVDVTADASGNITDSFNLPNSFVSDYDVTATGAQSGTVRTTFTDSNPNNVSVASPTSNAPGGVTQGNSATYGNVSVTFNGGSPNITEACTVTLGIAQQPSTTDTAIPAGVSPVFGNGTLSGVKDDVKTSTFAVSTTNATPTGTYRFHVTATRDSADPDCQGPNGGATFSTQQITLVVTAGNSAPVINKNNASVSVNEGQTATNTGTWSDANAGDTVTLSASVGTVTKSGTNASGTWSWSLGTADGPDQSQTVTITANDGKGGVTSTTFSLTVNNVAPNVTLSGPATADEGTIKHYTYTVSDPGNDTFTVSSGYPTCGTNGNLVGTPTVTATGGSFDCAFPDGPNNTSVAIKVADSDGASTTASESVQIVAVANVAPVVTAPANQSSSEGSSASFNLGSFTDPGPDSPWTVDVDWGDGSTHGTASKTSTGSLGTMNHAYADGPATYTVTVKVTDKNGGSDTESFQVTVNNVAPTVTLDPNNDLSVDEGSTHTYNYTISDPGQDTVQSVVTSCGANGTKVTGSDSNTNTAGSFKCTFPDGPNTSTVSAKATDSDGASDTASESVQIVAIANVAPVVTAAGNQSSSEGENHTFNLGSFTDPGSDSPWAVEVNWGDSSTDSTTKSATGSLGTMSHTYADGPATHTVTVKVTDKNGASHSQSFQVTVNNVAPTVTLDPNNDLNVDEGSTHTYNYTISDPGQDTVSSVTTSCGANGTKVTGSDSNTDTAGSFKCTFPDGPNTSTVSAKATDSDGASDTASESVQIVAIANVAPTVTAPANQSSNEGASASFNLGSFTDPGSDSPWAVEVNWGDSSTDSTTKSATGSLGTMSHTYADGPATHTVTVKVTDKNGGSDTESFQVTVNNVAPTVTLDPDNDLSVDEGSTHTYNYTISDPGQDTQTVVTSCGANGTKVTGSDTNTNTSGSFKCTFPDGPASSTVSAKATDSDGASDTASEAVQIVAVANVNPTLTAAANQSSNEGQSKLFSLGSFSDPGSDSPWAVDVAWGDSSPHTTFTETASGPATAQSITAKSHTYADEGSGTYTVTVKVTDKNGGSDTKSFTVNVTNEKPTASNGTFVFNPILGTATAGFDFSDAGYLDTHNLSYFNWSDVGNRTASVTEENVAPDATGHASDTRTLAPGCYPNLTVTGTAKDNDGATSAPLTLTSNTQQSIYSNAFRPPIQDNERNIAKYGNVVPVKVQLTNPCTGGTVTNANLYITLAKGTGNEAIEDTNVIAESVSSADTGSQMRVADGGYIFNLSTKNMSANTDWTVRVREGSTSGPILLQAVFYPKK